MLAYSQASASLPLYLATLRRLHYFWENNLPDDVSLPPEFHQFYQSYIAALRLDTGQPGFVNLPSRRNEIGFFYVLIGSSLGAKFILKKQGDNDIPRKSLEVLSTQGAALWKVFVDDHLAKVDPKYEHLVLQSSEQMFRDLYQNISYCDPRTS